MSSVLRIYHFDKPRYRGFVAGNTTRDIRMANARALSAEAGGPSSFAVKLGKELSYISQIIGMGKKGPTRGIGTQVARDIESAFGKDEGWLDVPHGPVAAMDPSPASPPETVPRPEEHAMDLQREAAELARAWLMLNDKDRQAFKRKLEAKALQNRDPVPETSKELGKYATHAARTAGRKDKVTAK